MKDDFGQKKESLWNDRKLFWLIVSIVVVVPMEIISLLSINIPLIIKIPICLALLFIFGRDVFISGLKSLFKLNFSSINLLMTIAVFGALYLRLIEEAVIIVVLFSLAEELENIGIKKSKTALHDLIARTPKTVMKRGDQEKVPVESIQIGQIVVFKPGDIIALDGIIVSGKALMDEATITGEPIPITKSVNDQVYAGTINTDGYLELRVTKSNSDSTISKIIELTNSAGKNKSQSQRFIERFAKYYTPTVMVISLLIVIVPVLFMRLPFDFWFAQALSLLVISCPCALVISTPIAVFSALGNANKQGALIKGGRFIEGLSRIEAIAFDKTRTLTTGKVRVSDIIALNGYDEKALISCAAGLEINSQHPLAQGIIEKAKELNVAITPATNFKSVDGRGIIGHCSICKTNSCLGNLNFVENKIEIDDQTRNIVQKFESEGKTTIIVANNDCVEGVIAIEDTLRSESHSLISFFKQKGISTIMLTGDNRSTAEYVAHRIGVESIYSNLLPEQKLEQINNLKSSFKTVAMVGDGVNDAPSLAAADIGITLGSVGSDLAIENADIAIMDDNLNKISFLYGLSKRTSWTIYFNICLALAIKVIFILLAVFGLSNLVFAIFADVGVSIIVILNSLALYRYQPKK